MEVLTKASLTATSARKLIEAAEAKAHSLGVPMAIAVVDESGVLKAFARMDGAPLLSIDIAKDKAYTAAAYGIKTNEWHDFIKGDEPLLHGIPKIPRLIIFGGGVPVRFNDATIGAIGISGGHYSQDQEVAEAAVAALFL